MPKLSEVFPSKYLAADADVPDFEDGGTVLTIRRCVMERVGQGLEASDKLVIYFNESDKGLVLNKTNGATITEVLGSDDTDDWEGHKIHLYAKDVEYQGKMTRGIRVSTRKPKAASKPKPAPAPVANDTDDDGDVPF